MNHYKSADIAYLRVIPRDLFNEAKLLKCMGRLCLKIEDRETPVIMSYENEAGFFTIGLMDDGYLTVLNLTVTIKGRPILFKTTYNGQSNWPLFAQLDNDEYQVFDDAGQWDSEFLSFCQQLKPLR